MNSLILNLCVGATAIATGCADDDAPGAMADDGGGESGDAENGSESGDGTDDGGSDETTTSGESGDPPAPVCGDGQLEGDEACDDGNDLDNDACLSDCTIPEGVRAVVAGPSSSHVCALMFDGNLRCWGDNWMGQLGLGHTDAIGDDEPASAAGFVDVGGPVTAAAVGWGHTCALLDDGAVKCWGDGTFGAVGQGNMDAIGDDETPASVGAIDLGGKAVQITAGMAHSCALLDDGAVRCWGASWTGQLGYANMDTIGDDEVPATAGAVQLGAPAVQIAAGDEHTCALLEGGAVRCWGAGWGGALGYGNSDMIGDDETPSAAGDVDVGGPVAELAVGGYHSCARLDSGAVRCWGNPWSGALGYGNTEPIGDDESPASAGDVSIGGTAVELVAGAFHTCARLDTDELRCYGEGTSGALGLGTTDVIGDDEPASAAGVVDVGGMPTQIVAGRELTCARIDHTRVSCFGFGFNGALGHGSTDSIGDDETPASIGFVPVL